MAFEMREEWHDDYYDYDEDEFDQFDDREQENYPAHSSLGWDYYYDSPDFAYYDPEEYYPDQQSD